MPVVRNDSSGPLPISGRGANESTLQPGEVRYLTDKEYEHISWGNRGVGRLVTIAPNENTSETLKIKFDYYQPASEYEIRYIGYARQSADDADEYWTIRRHTHDDVGGKQLIVEIQVLENVAWSDRAILPWT